QPLHDPAVQGAVLLVFSQELVGGKSVADGRRVRDQDELRLLASGGFERPDEWLVEQVHPAGAEPPAGVRVARRIPWRTGSTRASGSWLRVTAMIVPPRSKKSPNVWCRCASASVVSSSDACSENRSPAMSRTSTR